MSIEYRINETVSADDFIALLNDSTLGERRPVNDVECITGMLANSNLVVTAHEDGQLVGIARSVTDFHFACYLSDLAVALSHQRQGIGVELQRLTQQKLGPRCSLILLAAPAAQDYYRYIGFSNNPRCWVLDRDQTIGANF